MFVTTIDLKLGNKLREDLISQGFELTIPAHTLFSGKKPGISCTLYHSGKLVIQGKGTQEFVEFYLEPELLQQFECVKDLDIDLTPRIGIDESGKGDFFGPLCIAGVYAEGDGIKELKKMGICDSKKLNDKSIRNLAKSITDHYFHYIVKINPAKYNELYQQFGNLNHLLAWGHATTIENLSKHANCSNVIIDQFASEHVVINALKRKKLSITLTQRHRGEEDFVVAAASILARYAFIEGIDSLSQQFGINLPKGASQATIQAAQKFVSKYGKEQLGQVAKLHFKTTLSL